MLEREREREREREEGGKKRQNRRDRGVLQVFCRVVSLPRTPEPGGNALERTPEKPLSAHPRAGSPALAASCQFPLLDMARASAQGQRQSCLWWEHAPADSPAFLPSPNRLPRKRHKPGCLIQVPGPAAWPRSLTQPRMPRTGSSPACAQHRVRNSVVFAVPRTLVPSGGCGVWPAGCPIVFQGWGGLVVGNSLSCCFE